MFPDYYEQERDYDRAAICKRGHVITDHIEDRTDPIQSKCKDCGASVLRACLKCKAGIQGNRANTYGAYERPEFCTSCGTPMPWASRTARLYELENMLDEQELTDADRLTIREQLEALREPDATEADQEKHWLRIKAISPTLIDVGKEIIVSVTSSVIQKQLGLPG